MAWISWGLTPFKARDDTATQGDLLLCLMGKVSHYTQPEPLSFQLVPFASCPSTLHHQGAHLHLLRDLLLLLGAVRCSKGILSPGWPSTAPPASPSPTTLGALPRGPFNLSMSFLHQVPKPGWVSRCGLMSVTQRKTMPSLDLWAEPLISQHKSFCCQGTPQAHVQVAAHHRPTAFLQSCSPADLSPDSVAAEAYPSQVSGKYLPQIKMPQNVYGK